MSYVPFYVCVCIAWGVYIWIVASQAAEGVTP